MLGRMVPAVIIAAAIATLLAVPEIGGIATWKWMLGAIGLAVFLSGSRKR